MIPTGLIRRKIARTLSRYEPLIRVEISASAILHNYNAFKEYSGLQVAPVLKSNAYGHGLIEVATIFEKTQSPFLAVDSLFEAIALRRHGIKKPILIIGYTDPGNIRQMRQKNIAFLVVSIEQLEQLALLPRAINVHIQIETGMSRQGIQEKDWEKAIEILNGAPHIALTGIASHLAEADTGESLRTKKQEERFMRAIRRYTHARKEIAYIHLAATAGVAQTRKSGANTMRLGIGFTGIDPSGNNAKYLRPALRVIAPVVIVKEIEEGEWIGYGRTYKTKRKTRIGIIPMGYYEGIDRRRSNNGNVESENGKAIPIIGRVSMNMTTIDLTDTPEVVQGSNVCVLGGEGCVSCDKVAKEINTIPYEVMVHIPEHLRRTITEL